ncbi:MAG: hypothetical protein D6815_08725 [Candidatus Dadabacteria bacterium]|nr:MAG: hypothetical protein D6815_08725 [Candidatus Dadabacteria bacterium]
MRRLAGVLVAGAFLVGLSGVASADDGVQLSFGAAASYVQDLNDPTAAPGLNAATYSSMEQDESFNIDLIQIGITGTRGAASGHIKIDFGDLTTLSGDSTTGDVGLQEAYLSYDFGGAVGTVGRFATPIGYEVLEPWGNAQISRSWAWQGQPINHDGVTVSGGSDNIEAMIGAVNSFTVNDTVANDVDDEKGIIGSIGVALDDALNVYGAGLFSEFNDTIERQYYNLILSGNLDEVLASGLSYAIEGHYRQDDPKGPGSTDMWGITVYGGAEFGPTGIDLRWEYMDDEGLVLGANTELWSLTVTASWALADGREVRGEYRHDDADDPIFVDESTVDDTLDTLQAQVVWYPTSQ